MKLETFFEKFDQFADAPDAVAKMRELVLEFAVRGLLSERNAKDQTESAWVEFIGEFDNRIYDSDPGPPPPFEIPDEWRWVCLDDLGKTKVRNDVADRARVAFTPMALIPAGYGLPVQSEERTWSEVKKGFTHFADGDVVMAKITPCFENGKSAVMRKLLNGVGAGTTELHVFRRGTKTVLPEFVLIYLKTRGFITRGEPRMTGSAGQKRVPHDYFASSPFPLPPPAEQERLVAKVDELMALCDRLEAQQQERETRHAALARASLACFADSPTPANLDFLFHPSYAIPPADLRKAILTLAVQGKLVPQDPNDEPAEKLLETIAKQRAKLLGSDSLRRTKPCRQFTSGDAPNEIPKTWAWTMLGEVTDIGTGSTPSRTEASFWIDGTIPWITSGSTSRSPITEGGELVTPAAVKAHRLRVYPPGTLLVALYGQGKTRGQVAMLEIAATINQACAAICSLEGIPPMQGYLKLLLEKQYDEMRSLSAGGAQPNLNVQKIKEVSVPLPPLAEQRRIVDKVEQLMVMVDALETQLAASRATAAKLLEAIVAELTTSERVVERPIFDTTAYLVQLIPAMLKELQRPLLLDQLNAAIALLFLPDQLLPLLETTSGMEARSHFANFAQPNKEGSVNAAVQLLTKTKTLHYPESDGPVILHLNPAKMPPIDTVIATDAKYLAAIIDLVPAAEIEVKTKSASPKPVKKALLNV